MTMGTGAMLVLMSEEARVPLLMVQSSPMTLYRNRRLSGLTHTPGLKEEITALEVRLKELFDVVKSDRGSPRLYRNRLVICHCVSEHKRGGYSRIFTHLFCFCLKIAWSKLFTLPCGHI